MCMKRRVDHMRPPTDEHFHLAGAHPARDGVAVMRHAGGPSAYDGAAAMRHARAFLAL